MSKRAFGAFIARRERDINVFPVTRSSKQKTDRTTRFVTTIEKQRNKNHSKIPNFVKQDFLKTEGPQGVRWNDRGLPQLRKIHKIHSRLEWMCKVCMWICSSVGHREFGKIIWCPKIALMAWVCQVNQIKWPWLDLLDVWLYMVFGQFGKVSMPNDFFS